MKMEVNRDSCVTGLRQDKNTWTKSQWLNERAHWFHQFNIYDQLMTIRIYSHDVHTLVFSPSTIATQLRTASILTTGALWAPEWTTLEAHGADESSPKLLRSFLTLTLSIHPECKPITKITKYDTRALLYKDCGS